MRPTTNGLELLSKLKNDSHHNISSIPVVILSSEKEMSAEVTSHGAEFLNKPFNAEEIAAVVNRFC
jgi:DNA-binding response OmpR family regulator